MLIDWFLLPVDTGRVHEVSVLVSWHGRLMVLAWGIFIPLGILFARFFKITPKQDWPNELDNRFWWRNHLLLQNSGILLMLVAVGLIWFAPRHGDQTGNHFMFGWTLVGFGLVQMLGGYSRGTKGGPTAPAPDGSLRGDHYDMTPRRVLFEKVHKFLGYAAVLLAVAAILTGLWQANAPRWFFIVIAGWWTMLAIASAIFQRRGMVVDTYQAIWGPDPVLPGNQRSRPVGFGIRRHGDGEKGTAGE